jgi:hypothetical protein
MMWTSLVCGWCRSLTSYGTSRANMYVCMYVLRTYVCMYVCMYVRTL